jgi:hypothetical protein
MVVQKDAPRRAGECSGYGGGNGAATGRFLAFLHKAAPRSPLPIRNRVAGSGTGAIGVNVNAYPVIPSVRVAVRLKLYLVESSPVSVSSVVPTMLRNLLLFRFTIRDKMVDVRSVPPLGKL